MIRETVRAPPLPVRRLRNPRSITQHHYTARLRWIPRNGAALIVLHRVHVTDRFHMKPNHKHTISQALESQETQHFDILPNQMSDIIKKKALLFVTGIFFFLTHLMKGCLWIMALFTLTAPLKAALTAEAVSAQATLKDCIKPQFNTIIFLFA